VVQDFLDHEPRHACAEHEARRGTPQIVASEVDAGPLNNPLIAFWAWLNRQFRAVLVALTPYNCAMAAIEAGDGALIIGNYRYRLWRIWDPCVTVMVWVLLNPSEANETKDDPTLRKCMGFARRHRHGGVILVNLFAWRDPYPTGLRSAADPIGPHNDEHILWACGTSTTIVAGWGAHRFASDRAHHVYELIRRIGERDLHCFGKTKNGFPRHPARLAYSSLLKLF
jgi:hypothetical protein